MAERKTKASRISNKAHAYLTEKSKETGITITKLIDIALWIEDEPQSNKAIKVITDQEAFKQPAIGQALEAPWVKDAIAAYARDRLPKPPKAVMDSAILINFLIDPEYPPVKYRKDLLASVRKQMTEDVNEGDKYPNWSAVYTEFFEGHEKSHSRFEKYFDNRIRALINVGILLSLPTADNQAMYRLIELAADSEQLVIAINKIEPRTGLVLPSITS